MNLINKKIVVYTCVYGDYDTPPSFVKQNISCDYICFTDNPKFKHNIYKTVVFRPLDYFNQKESIDPINYNIVNAALFKSNLNLIEPLKGYDICVYIDGNCGFKKTNVLSQILSNKNLDDHCLILSRHPVRDCIYQEAMASTNPKYKYTDLKSQINFYRSEGYPEHNGLFWNGFIIYLKPFDPIMNDFYHLYTEELLKYTRDKTKYYHMQGQVSMPYVLWKLNVRVFVIPSFFDNGQHFRSDRIIRQIHKKKIRVD